MGVEDIEDPLVGLVISRLPGQKPARITVIPVEHQAVADAAIDVRADVFALDRERAVDAGKLRAEEGEVLDIARDIAGVYQPPPRVLTSSVMGFDSGLERKRTVSLKGCASPF